MWGIANFLQRLLANHSPDFLGWVHDSGLSFRHERFPAYKATRQKLSEELQSDFDRGMERIGQLLDAYRIPILTMPGYEADDVIGTLTANAVARKLNVVIVSGDKDFHQLVRPGVWLLNPGRGGSSAVDEHWVGEQNASERLGVAPNQVTDYLALVGDASDNIPGVKGIGDKTARALVARYGSLEAILAAAPHIEQKRPREALIGQADTARLSKDLVTIRTDLPVVLDLEALTVRAPQMSRLREIFVELEFHTLAKAAGEAADATSLREEEGAQTSLESVVKDSLLSDSPAAIRPTYVTVTDISSMRAAVDVIRRKGRASIEVTTVADGDGVQVRSPLRSRLVGVAIGVDPGYAFYFPFGHSDPRSVQTGLPLGEADGREDVVSAEDARGAVEADSRKVSTAMAGAVARNLPPLLSEEMLPLRILLEAPDVPKTAHNAKHQILALRLAGVTLRGIDFDTLLASYILDPQRRSHEIDVLALEVLNQTLPSYEDICGRGRAAIRFVDIAVDVASRFACGIVDMILRIRQILESQLDTQNASRLLQRVELPLVRVLAQMEWMGIAIDRPWFVSLKTRFQAERERVERAIYLSAGEEFNINSNVKLRQILFEKAQFPVRKRTPSGPSTDASVLSELAEEGHVLPSLLLEYRELTKLQSTYIDTLPALVDPRDKRLHTSFNQTVAATGRLSSSDPNLQNIPIRREMGKDIRRGFVPRPNWHLLSADYSQIELRLLAHLSSDPAFVTAFRTGGDIHRQTAAHIFDLPVEKVTGAMRARAKTINFATIYGQGAHALAQQLHIGFDEAKDFITRYFERFQGVREFLDNQVALARVQGYVETIYGRRRYIPQIRDRNFNIRAFGERTAANSPIQGSAADLIKVAMIRITEALEARELKTQMLLQVHDELLFEVPSAEIVAASEIVRHEMEHAIELTIPLVVDIGFGDNWMAAKPA
ncbi:MAG: DNA polymerase I [Gemmatimonadaceae bacterium]